MFKQQSIFSSAAIFEGTVYYQNKQITSEGVHKFKETIWHFYNAHARLFPWRTTLNPYHIVVSEVMLQQTQTHRVEPKFITFIQELPTFKALAQASQHNVLSLWQGLGYNRRALGLQKLAQIIDRDFDGQLPNDPIILESLPTIGHYTARSVATFAFNIPTVFIETNIRAVYIHTFLGNRSSKIHDKELMPLVEQTVDTTNPRLWYYALMDYGVMLKKIFKNPSRKSKHHNRQSKFEGSDRQIRGMIIKLLTQHIQLDHTILIEKLCQTLSCHPERAMVIIDTMRREQFIKINQNIYSL